MNKNALHVMQGVFVLLMGCVMQTKELQALFRASQVFPSICKKPFLLCCCRWKKEQL